MRFRKTKIFFGALALLCLVFYVAGIEPERAAAQIAPLSTHQTQSGPVLIVGGTRATGLEVARILLARGDAVTVLARPTSNTAEAQKLGAKVVRGNALSASDMTAALASDKFAAVITLLGTTGKDRPRPDFEGNKNVFDAAKAAGVRRVLFVTVIGTGDSAGREPWIAGRFLREVITLKSQAEDYLRASGLDYTIIRPGGLVDSDANNVAFLTGDHQSFSWIARGDLALLTVRALDDPQAVGQTYHAHDPKRTRFWVTFEQLAKLKN